MSRVGPRARRQSVATRRTRKHAVPDRDLAQQAAQLVWHGRQLGHKVFHGRRLLVARRLGLCLLTRHADTGRPANWAPVVADVHHTRVAGNAEHVVALEWINFGECCRGQTLVANWTLTRRLASSFCHAERDVEPTRPVPLGLDNDGRQSFLAIAKRAQNEAVHLYSVLFVGAEMYKLSRKLKTA